MRSGRLTNNRFPPALLVLAAVALTGCAKTSTTPPVVVTAKKADPAPVSPPVEQSAGAATVESAPAATEQNPAVAKGEKNATIAAEPDSAAKTEIAVAPADPAAPDAATPSAPQNAAAESKPSASWPNFRNGTDLRGIAGTTLPDKLDLLWELETHDGVTSTAAILNGFAYVAELSGFIRCLDLRSGQELWHYRTIESENPEEFAPGFNAPVTVSEAGVFIGDEDGTLHALDRESGRPLWPPFKTGDQIKGGVTVLSPDSEGGAPRLLFGSHDGALYCLNSKPSETLWKFDTRGPVNGSQAIHGEHTFVSGCDQPILRVVNISSGQQSAEIPLDGSLLIASPALIGDVLYFGTPDGDVIALDWVKQQRVWTYSDPSRKQEIHSSPAVTDKLILIGSRDKRLHAIDRQTGKAAWTFETRGPIDSSPVIVGERIFFGSADRNVYAVDFSGKEVWKHNAGRRISASPAVGEGHLVIGCEGSEGKILCFGEMK